MEGERYYKQGKINDRCYREGVGGRYYIHGKINNRCYREGVGGGKIL